jgi:hypothetical protein
MATQTVNKNLTEPVQGVDTNWGTTLNANFTNTDAALGTVQNISVTGVTSTITLVATYPAANPPYSYVPLVLNITGVLGQNLSIQIPSGVGGQWIVYNNTSGSFTLTLSSGGGGSSITLPQSYHTCVYSDGTNIQIADDGILQNLTNLSLSGYITTQGAANLGTGASAVTNLYGNTSIGNISVTAGSFVIGQTYTITSVGSTNFTLVGASGNTVGVTFTATGVGSGTGTATTPTANLTVSGNAVITGSITPSGVITPRIQSVASTSTAPNSNTADIYELAIGASTIASFPAPSGSPIDGQKLIIRIIPSGAVTITAWNAAYRVIGTTLPTSLTSAKTTYVGCIYNTASSTWDVIAVGTQA